MLALCCPHPHLPLLLTSSSSLALLLGLHSGSCSEHHSGRVPDAFRDPAGGVRHHPIAVSEALPLPPSFPAVTTHSQLPPPYPALLLPQTGWWQRRACPVRAPTSLRHAWDISQPLPLMGINAATHYAVAHNMALFHHMEHDRVGGRRHHAKTASLSDSNTCRLCRRAVQACLPAISNKQRISRCAPPRGMLRAIQHCRNSPRIARLCGSSG